MAVKNNQTDVLGLSCFVLLQYYVQVTNSYFHVVGVIFARYVDFICGDRVVGVELKIRIATCYWL